MDVSDIERFVVKYQGEWDDVKRAVATYGHAGEGESELAVMICSLMERIEKLEENEGEKCLST